MENPGQSAHWGWNTANVTDMMGMFRQTQNFNQDIGEWDTSSVTDMSYMFDNSSSFNQDIGGWDVSNVVNMDGMFSTQIVSGFSSAFNQDLSGWCVSNITSEPSSFVTDDSALEQENMPVWGTCPSASTAIYFEDDTCKCPEASVGDTATIDGVVYTVVDNASLASQIAIGNINLCTTLVTDMGELFSKSKF